MRDLFIISEKKRSAKRIFRELRKRRKEAVGMNKKQKKVLVRIIIAAVLMIVFGFLLVDIVSRIVMRILGQEYHIGKIQ